MRPLLAMLAVVVVAIAATPAAADWETSELAGMRVLVYRPTATGTVGAGRPLLIALHGCAQQPESLRDRAQWRDTAEAFGLVVALPAVPNGGIYTGCWDFYGEAHDRGGRHNRPLLEMTASLLADGNLGVDPAQVYIAGLSSGAGQAAILGCLAPDVYAGVGMVAGLAVGANASDIAVVSTTPERAAEICRRLAGENAGELETQIASVVQGEGDFIVTTRYLRVNAETYAILYGGAGLIETSSDVTSLPGAQPTGTRLLWHDAAGPRVEMISLSGMGHAWPGGTGQGGEAQFVAGAGLDYAAHLAALFTSANRRIDGAVEPMPEPEPDPAINCESASIEGADGTVLDHLSRFDVYDGGYGAADATYTDLLNQYGLEGVITLYEGSDGRWYHDPDNVPTDSEDCSETPAPEPPAPDGSGLVPPPIPGDETPPSFEVPDADPAPATHESNGGCRMVTARPADPMPWWLALIAWRRRRDR